jgi:phytoene dehydrogenase-like protein
MVAADAVLVGSGINALVAAALLAKAGWQVQVLERGDRLGGAIRTAEITAPGFQHDVFSAWHPLFVGSAAYRELQEDLQARGLTYLNTAVATASLYPDGTSIFLTTSPEDNVAEFARHAPGDGEAWARAVAAFLTSADLAFGLLGAELWSTDGLRLALRATRRLGPRGVLAFTGSMLESCRDWLTATFASPAVHGLLAP